jgi:hypothetical protein
MYLANHYMNPNIPISILTVISILFGCSNHSGETEDFTFNEKYLYSRTVHNYEFHPDGKIKSDFTTNYYYEDGVPTDTSMVEQDQFFYNSKGNVERILNFANSSEQFKIYNNLDSLVADYTIIKGDTFLVNKFNFQNEKKVKRTSLMFLRRKSPHDLSYDTVGSISELVYTGEILDKEIRKYTSGEVTQVHYYPTCKKDLYDFVVIGAKGDTSTITKNIFQENRRIVTYEHPPEPSKDTLYYDNSRLVRKVHEEHSINTRYSYSFKYDKKGNILEMSCYLEPLGTSDQ